MLDRMLTNTTGGQPQGRRGRPRRRRQRAAHPLRFCLGRSAQRPPPCRLPLFAVPRPSACTRPACRSALRAVHPHLQHVRHALHPLLLHHMGRGVAPRAHRQDRQLWVHGARGERWGGRDSSPGAGGKGCQVRSGAPRQRCGTAERGRFVGASAPRRCSLLLLLLPTVVPPRSPPPPVTHTHVAANHWHASHAHTCTHRAHTPKPWRAPSRPYRPAGVAQPAVRCAGRHLLPGHVHVQPVQPHHPHRPDPAQRRRVAPGAVCGQGGRMAGRRQGGGGVAGQAARNAVAAAGGLLGWAAEAGQLWLAGWLGGWMHGPCLMGRGCTGPGCAPCWPLPYVAPGMHSRSTRAAPNARRWPTATGRPCWPRSLRLYKMPSMRAGGERAAEAHRAGGG